MPTTVYTAHSKFSYHVAHEMDRFDFISIILSFYHSPTYNFVISLFLSRNSKKNEIKNSSAYNDDPFNAQQNAQDSWLEARKAKRQRVAAKVKELEQTERERLGVKDSTDRKSARPGRDVYKGGDVRRWFTWIA